jgi:dolichol-phosphate mannosyltransferase
MSTPDVMPGKPTLCVCVPTYNEAANIARFVAAVLRELDRLELDGVVLVIDDGSPDGTGEIADRLAAGTPHVHVLHRTEKAGIGRAYQAGFGWALEREFDHIFQMDCDFSHDPAYLEAMLAAARDADLVLGSRYVAGSGVADWPLARRLISRGGSTYARLILGLPVRDLTGGYKCFRRSVLERLPYDQAGACGYGFQIETTYRAVRAGFRVAELPILFRDRTEGESKMSLAIAREAALLVLKLRLGRDVALRESRSQKVLLPVADARVR